MKLPEPGQSIKLEPARAFALCLSEAVKQFDVLLAILRHEISITINAATDANEPYLIRRRAQLDEAGSELTVCMSLAKGFLFYARRAHRLCKQSIVEMIVDEAKCKDFLGKIAPVVRVRNANEHGLDPEVFKGSEIKLHQVGGGLIDDTSIEFAGPEKIMLGALNLVDIYKIVGEMNEIAGHKALPPIDPLAPQEAP